MTTIYRAEKQTDPDKLPGQIINRPPQAVYLRDIIQRIEEQEDVHPACIHCRDSGGLDDGYGTFRCWCEKGQERDDL